MHNLYVYVCHICVLKWQIDKGRRKEKKKKIIRFFSVSLTLFIVCRSFSCQLLFMMNKFSILHIEIIHVEWKKEERKQNIQTDNALSLLSSHLLHAPSKTHTSHTHTTTAATTKMVSHI